MKSTSSSSNHSHYTTFYLKTKFPNAKTKPKLDYLDYDRLSNQLINAKDTIIHLKAELNEKTKEMALLKVSYMKKEKELVNYSKSISEIVRLSDISSIHSMSAISRSIEDNKKLPNLPDPILLTPTQRKHMTEIIQMTTLKTKLQETTSTVETQNKEIQELKENQTVSNIKKYNYIENNNELNIYKEQNRQLQRDNEDLNYFLKAQIEKLKSKDQFCKIFHQFKTVIKRNHPNSNANNNNTMQSTFSQTAKSTSNKWPMQHQAETLSIEESLKMAEVQMQKMQKQIYDLTTIVEDNKRTIYCLEESNSELMDKNNKLKNNIEILKKNKRELMDKLALTNPNSHKGGSNVTYSNSNANDDRKSEELQSKIEVMETQMKKLIDINKELHTYLSDTERMYNDERAKVEEYEKELIEYSSIKQKLNEEMKQNEEFQRKIKELNMQIDSMNSNAKANEIKAMNDNNQMDFKDNSTIEKEKGNEKEKEKKDSNNSNDIDELMDKFIYDEDKDANSIQGNDEVEQNEEINYVSSSEDIEMG